jgi:hypothetical protein
LFRLHEEFIALVAIASSAHLAQFLEGYFVVKGIDAEQRDVHVDLSLAAISGSFFAPGGRYAKKKDEFESDVYQKVMDNLAGEAKFFGLELTEELSFDGTKRIFFPKTKIHCECQLLAFLHRNPFVPFVHYIGLSKRPCYGCHLYLHAYNEIIGKHVGRTYSSRPTHGNVRLPWASPALQTDGVECSVVDAEVRRNLVDSQLQPALWDYVDKTADAIREKRNAIVHTWDRPRDDFNYDTLMGASGVFSWVFGSCSPVHLPPISENRCIYK